MITYQEIYEALRKEKYTEALQQLPSNFLQEISDYISDKKNILSRDSDFFSDTLRMTRKQFDNALSIVKELLVIRQRKVLNLAFVAAVTGISKRDVEALLDYEKELFDILVKQLEQNQKLIAEILNGKIEKKDLKNLFVRFKQDVPAFLDGSGLEFGPFKRGEVANLPKEIAEILFADNKATQIEEES